MDLILAGTSDTTSPSSLSLRFETRMNDGSEGPVIQQVYLIRAGSNRKELVDSRPVGNFEGQIEITPQGDPSRFVNPANGDVTARIVYLTDPGGPLFPWIVALDEVVWFID